MGGDLGIFFAVCLFARGLGAAANENAPDSVCKCGASPSAIAARIEALRQGLRELGYMEGKNIMIEWRFAEGKVDRLPALVAEISASQSRRLLSCRRRDGPPVLPRTRRRQSLSSWLRIPIPLETGSLPALRDLAGILLDSPPIPRR